jgi:CHAT domain-containing protein
LQASSAFRNWKQQFDVKWEPLQKTLKPDEASIEFVSYHIPNAGEGALAHYAALVVKPGAKNPAFVPLFSEVDFNKLISKSSSSEAVVKKLYRSTIKSASSQAQPSDSLYHLIRKPLLPHLEKVNTIYFAADGLINNLNLAAIIKPDGRRLVEDYEFIQLSSTRNILKKNPQPIFTNMQLWGGVQYDSATSSTTNRLATFTYLPGTLTEINGIVSTANQSQIKAKTYVAAEANETAFKNLSGKSPEVLHIATHGFFFPDPTTSTKAGENRFSQSENPLLRSGLALANANVNWTNQITSSEKEDGILTAYEIADMDLSNTKLVVLSACETGLGDVKSGEGVYGLQRAFKMAGVNYLIMSLWQVPDLETKEFMQTFYTKSLAGTPIRKAFRETQLEMNKKYQPYQWAAFVLVE